MAIARNGFYHMMMPLIHLYFRIVFRFRILSNPLRNAKVPYLVLGHHVKSDDPLFVMVAAGRLVHYLAADANMDTPWKRHLFNAMGMVPFKKKKSDMKSIRQLVKLTKAGKAIGLYPEGGRNWDGQTDTIALATAKLIKMLGIDVYITFYKGGYLSQPRWADHRRRGRIDFEGLLLFSKEQVKTLDLPSLHEQLIEGLTYNEYDWQRQNRIPFKGNNKAQGITRLLFICPNCRSLHQLEAHGDGFSCTACQADYHLDDYGFIHGPGPYDNTADWHRWQKSQMTEIAHTMTSVELKDIYYEKRNSKSGNKAIYPHCDVVINKKAILVTSPSGQNWTLPITHTYGYSFTLKDIFEFFTTDSKHRLIFRPERHLSNVFVLCLLNQLKEMASDE